MIQSTLSHCTVVPTLQFASWMGDLQSFIKHYPLHTQLCHKSKVSAQLCCSLISFITDFWWKFSSKSSLQLEQNSNFEAFSLWKAALCPQSSNYVIWRDHQKDHHCLVVNISNTLELVFNISSLQNGCNCIYFEYNNTQRELSKNLNSLYFTSILRTLGVELYPPKCFKSLLWQNGICLSPTGLFCYSFLLSLCISW